MLPMVTKVKKVSKKEILEVREIFRKFAKNKLDTEQKTQEAVKAIGTTRSYLKKALLGERKKGGLDTWIALMIVIARMEECDLIELLDEILSMRNPFQTSASKSEQIFRQLDKINIINEDVKYKIAETLEMILLEMEKNMKKRK